MISKTQLARHEKRPDVCAQCEDPTWCYQTRNGPLCGACRAENFFRRVLFGPAGLTFLPWVREELRAIYGPVHQDTGVRKIRRVYEEIPKKNGKSTWVGGMPLYHLTVEAEEIDNPKAYGAASAKDQAGLVFDAAESFVKSSRILQDRLKVLPSTKRIVRRDGHGFYQVLSADGDLQDGIDPSFFVRDELHRWKTAKAKTLADILVSGQIARAEPLGVDITTAGDVYESPICWPVHQRAKQIVEGSLKSDSFHARIFAADEERMKADPEYWKTRQCRVEANPSHEDHGGFLKDAAILEKLEELGESAYKRYHENIWGQKVDRWMPMSDWLRCGGETKSLMNRECWLGLDLSTTTAMTGLVLVFPAADGSLDILSFAWVPRAQIPALEKRTHQPIGDWVRAGLIQATDTSVEVQLPEGNRIKFEPGQVVDYGAVRKRIDWAKANFRVQEICYDPWNATQFVTGEGGLIESGYRCIEIRQGPPTLSPAMKFLMEKTMEGKIRHGNNEVMNWHMDCVSARSDQNANIAPSRDRLDKEGKRIDLASALITALARYIRIAPTRKPLCLTEGVL